jgi:hypothetical protein
MPNVTLLQTLNVTNLTASSDPIQSIFTYGASATNYFAGGLLMVGLWLITYFAFSGMGRNTDAGILASAITMFASILFFFYAGFVTLSFVYLTIAVLIGFVLMKALSN